MADDMTRRDVFSGLVTSTTVGQTWALNSLQPKGITFSPGITIDAQTGNVTIPEGLSLDEASRAFWTAVQSVFPQLCEAKKTTP